MCIRDSEVMTEIKKPRNEKRMGECETSSPPEKARPHVEGRIEEEATEPHVEEKAEVEESDVFGDGVTISEKRAMTPSPQMSAPHVEERTNGADQRE